MEPGFAAIPTDGTTCALIVKPALALLPKIPVEVGVAEVTAILYPLPVAVPAGIVIIFVRPGVIFPSPVPYAAEMLKEEPTVAKLLPALSLR